MKKQSRFYKLFLLSAVMIAIIGCGEASQNESQLNSMAKPEDSYSSFRPDFEQDRPDDGTVFAREYDLGELEACSIARPGDCISGPIKAASDMLKDLEKSLKTSFENFGLTNDVRSLLEGKALALAQSQANSNRDVCIAAVAAGITAFIAEAGLIAGPWGAVIGGFFGAGGGLLLAQNACAKVFP